MGEKQIKEMYNEGAKAFNEYLKEHDIAKFTENATAIIEKYEKSTAVCGLMIWWGARVQCLHDEYMGGSK